MLARSCISGGTGEGEKEARRCMSHRSPPLQKNKDAKVATRPLDLDWINSPLGAFGTD